MCLSDDVRPHRFHPSLGATEPWPMSTEPGRLRLDVTGQPVRLLPLQRIPEHLDRDDGSEAPTTSTLDTSWITLSSHLKVWRIVLVCMGSGGQWAVT